MPSNTAWPLFRNAGKSASPPSTRKALGNRLYAAAISLQPSILQGGLREEQAYPRGRDKAISTAFFTQSNRQPHGFLAWHVLRLLIPKVRSHVG
jgi:hypothetical protein